MDDARLIPDERLRLIFVCCHPAVAVESRAALTLRLVCGLAVADIARAFLVTETALAQRLLRAKRKIADSGVPFEIPLPDAWPERIEAVLSTLEVAYSKAHEDAAGTSNYAGYAEEIRALTKILADLLPNDPEVLAFAATVRYAEARRSARVDAKGVMVPLSEQDPELWNRTLIADADALQARAIAQQTLGPRLVQAQIHRAWCARASLDERPPWRTILSLYDMLLEQRDDLVIRLNRAVALSEVAGPQAAFADVEQLDPEKLAGFLPFHVVRADLLRRLGRHDEARVAYDRALALHPASAEQRWLTIQRQRCALRADSNGSVG
jgi:RNA polymerase sigma-70 factor (ECF subfamily)